MCDYDYNYNYIYTGVYNYDLISQMYKKNLNFTVCDYNHNNYCHMTFFAFVYLYIGLVTVLAIS